MPDGRRWLVVNSKAIRYADKIILCHITSATNAYDRSKRLSPTDLPVPAVPGLDKWSYVCCSVIYTANRIAVEKFLGQMPLWLMDKVDEFLLDVLALKPVARQMVAKEQK